MSCNNSGTSSNTDASGASTGNEDPHVDETGVLCRGREPGSQVGEQAEPGAAKHDWECENDDDRDGDDERGRRMDGTTSGTGCESKRLKTRSLAEQQTCQHG